MRPFVSIIMRYLDDYMVAYHELYAPDSAKSKIDKFSKITNHNKVLLNSLPMNGHVRIKS